MQSSREIDDMIKNILTAKRGGYVTPLGYEVKGAPISSLETMCRAGLRYGKAPR